jgi:hypothetical protein
VALATIKGDRTLGQLAEHFDVHPNQITTWKAQFVFRVREHGCQHAGGFYFASASIRASNAEDKLKLEIGDEENRIDCCDRCGDPALFLRQGSWASRP